MRRTKSGAIHKHSRNIQDFARVKVDPREMLAEETRQYLRMLRRWDDGSRAAGIVKAACKNLLESLGRGESA
jgi:hypothetical protein